jgi:hypothetical protein
MATLNELMDKFASDSSAEPDLATGDTVVPDLTSVDNGHNKTASEGEPQMKSLTDLYLSIQDADMQKEASAAAYVEYTEDETELDFAKIAGAIADAEADDLVYQDDEDQGGDLMKVAAEYDSAGRIMARGFYDEFMKLAGAMDTDVSENQNTENPSVAQTPALGQRELVTVPTNYAGSPDNDQPIETAGSAPQQVYADVLKAPGSMSAGSGTMNPDQGTLGHFATVQDMVAKG